jgi:hypothetical protein
MKRSIRRLAVVALASVGVLAIGELIVHLDDPNPGPPDQDVLIANGVISATAATLALGINHLLRRRWA